MATISEAHINFNRISYGLKWLVEMAAVRGDSGGQYRKNYRLRRLMPCPLTNAPHALSLSVLPLHEIRSPKYDRR